MKKKLFMTFGPIVIAFLMFIGLLALPANENSKTLRNASQAVSLNIISGEHIKNKAISEKEYVPFFGSSELNRFDPFHPTVLAEKYHRPYRPFLIGSAGTQSLKQYMIMTSMEKDLKHKKAVFIISPQWFVKDGVEQQYFSHWYSGVQMYHWLDSVSKKSSYDQVDRIFAKRLQHFTIINQNTTLMRYLKKIANNKALSTAQRSAIQRQYRTLMHEDYLYERIGLTDKNWKRVIKYTKQLPEHYDYEKLNQLAGHIGKENTTSNDMEIANNFYNTRLRAVIKSLKGSQKDFSYLQSPEYADFQLVLSELSKTKTDVLFIIPPVNPYWMQYTGLSQDMMHQFGIKITKQLKSQGFNHVVNLIDDHEPYSMTDTIHVGWRGWLRLDKEIRPFLESPYQTPHYQLNDYYFSKNWQDKILK